MARIHHICTCAVCMGYAPELAKAVKLAKADADLIAEFARSERGYEQAWAEPDCDHYGAGRNLDNARDALIERGREILKEREHE